MCIPIGDIRKNNGRQGTIACIFLLAGVVPEIKLKYPKFKRKISE